MSCILRGAIRCYRTQQQQQMMSLHCRAFSLVKVQTSTQTPARKCCLPEINKRLPVASFNYFSTEASLPFNEEDRIEDVPNANKKSRRKKRFVPKNKFIADENTVYVGAHDYHMDKTELESIFSQFGTVKHVEIPVSKTRRKSTKLITYQYAWVVFDDTLSYEKAIQTPEIQLGCGKSLSIEKAQRLSREDASERRILFKGFGVSYDVTYLKDLFSQFGEVLQCEIYQKQSAVESRDGEMQSIIESRDGETQSAVESRDGETQSAVESRDGETQSAVESRDGETQNAVERRDGYTHGHITFSNKESVSLALSTKNIPTSVDGNGLDLQAYSYLSKENVNLSKDAKQSLLSRTYYVTGLPEGVIVQQIYNYFIGFTGVELINLVSDIRLRKDPTTVLNFAYIQLNEACHESILDVEHTLDGCVLGMTKSLKICKPNKCKIVKLNHLPNEITFDELYSHFSNFGTVRNVSIAKGSDGGGVIWFEDEKDAISAASNPTHEIKGSCFNARLVGLRSEG